MADSEARLKEKHQHWEHVRDVVKHEDDLVNQRLTWIFSTHTFLYAAFGLLQSKLMDSEWMPIAPYVLIQLLAILFLGVALRFCQLMQHEIDTATAHLDHLGAWWMARYPEESYRPRRRLGTWIWSLKPSVYPLAEDSLLKPFPPVIGRFELDSRVGVDRLPRLFARADLVLILLTAGLLAVVLVRGGQGLRPEKETAEATKPSARGELEPSRPSRPSNAAAKPPAP